MSSTMGRRTPGQSDTMKSKKVRHMQEDLYDGQVLQKLVEKLANIRDLVAIMQLVIALAIFFRAPIRLPEHVSVKSTLRLIHLLFSKYKHV
uniref:Calponin-homology (CH) domain-containing protein n=1 Tax=Heterorhabditis bacteriophora TaxID=37862 RepID=A0A1I7WMX1_HETBA